jgi:hypothetical protein
MGSYREAVFVGEGGKVYGLPAVVRDIRAFARIRDRNIKHQGFVEAAETHSDVETITQAGKGIAYRTDTQRLQEHASSPVVTFNRRSVAVFRLDCTSSRDNLVGHLLCPLPFSAPGLF